jgi:glycogen synthase
VVPDELREAVAVCRTNRAHLREALRSLVTIGDAERASMGERAREACRTLDWAALADRYGETYQSVIRRTP